MSVNKISGILLALGIIVGAVGGFGFSFFKTSQDLSTYEDTIMDKDDVILDQRKRIDNLIAIQLELLEELREIKMEKYALNDELTNARRELEVLKMQKDWEQRMEQLKQALYTELQTGKFPIEEVEKFPVEEVGGFETKLENFNILITKFETGEIKEFPVEEIEIFKTDISKLEVLVSDFKQLIAKFPLEGLERFNTDVIRFETEIELFKGLITKYEIGEINEFPVEEIRIFNVEIGRFTESIIEFKGLIGK